MSRFVEEIKNYLIEHSEIEVVSFDIFNTVLLRNVGDEEDVFEEAGKHLTLPDEFTAEEYKYIRQQTQRNIQRKKEAESGSAEVSLEEVADAMPEWLGSKKNLVMAEVSAEKEVCFLNPEWNNFFNWLEERNYTIFYISDMYLSAAQISEILITAGAPELKVYVSNEYGTNKKSGELFLKVQQAEGLEAKQMVHIGDNFEGDVIGAEKCGIKAFYYDAVNTDITYGLAMEEYVCGKTNKNALRKVAAYNGQGMDEELQQWFALGAEMVGPMLAYFMEWLYKQVRSNGDEKLLFLMREGNLFQRAWQIFSDHCDIDIQNELLYVSRQALLLPSMEKFGEEELGMVWETPQISVIEIFDLLQVTKGLEPFIRYAHVQRKDFETVRMGNGSLGQALKDFLLAKENVSIIEAHIKSEGEKAKKYLARMCNDKHVATVDIGYQGTIQKRLEKVLPNNMGRKWNHYLLLCNGEKRLGDLECTNIRGALGTWCGETSELMSVVNRNNRSLELLFIDGCGSTLGYEETTSGVKPVLGMLQWPQEQKRHIKACQDGALTYLKLYCGCHNKCTWKKEELLGLLHRLLSHPSYIEAKLLGNLVFDENNGTQYSRKICEERDVSLIREQGVLAWQQKVDYREIQWIEGLLTLGDKSYILRNGKKNCGYNESYALGLVKSLLSKHVKSIYIVAAGVVGRLVAKYARMVDIRVVAFVDNNPLLYGKTIDGVSVIRLKDCDDIHTYVIASISYKEELRIQVMEEKGQRADTLI